MIPTFQLGQFGRAGRSATAALSGLELHATGLKSVRALKRKFGGYAGACLRARRSSDNAEQDVGFVSAAIDAAVDTATLLTWSGADSVFITKIYDQSGNGDDWIQATAGKQPRFVNAGTPDGFVRFDASDDSMESTSNAGAVAVYHGALVGSLRGGAANRVVLEKGTGITGNSDNNVQLGTNISAPVVRVLISQGLANYIGSQYANTYLPTSATTVWCQWSYPTASPYRENLYVDGASITRAGSESAGTVGTGTTGTANKWFLGARNNSLFFSDLDWYADAFYEGTVSDVEKASISAILKR